MIKLLQWSISIGALCYALYGIDINHLLQSIKKYTFFSMFCVLSVLFLDYFCMSLRLKCLLPKDFNFKKSFLAIILCIGYNNLLPAKAGDAIKIAWIKNRSNLNYISVTSKILWERCFDIVGLLCVSALAYTLADTGRSILLPAIIFIIILTCFFICRYWSQFFHHAYQKYLPQKIATFFSDFHANLIDNISSKIIISGLILTFLIWCNYLASFYISINFVANFNLNFAQILTVFAITSIGTALPSSPGGLGIFEGAMVLSLSWLGINHNDALGIALFLHAVHFIPSAIGAIIIGNLTKKSRN